MSLKQNRSISGLAPGVQELVLRLGLRVAKSPFFRDLNVRMKLTEGVRSKERAMYLWGKGRTRDDFVHLGLYGYAKYANPSARKVTWLDNPLDTNHLTGIAFDVVLGVRGLWGKIKHFIWGKKLNGKEVYRELGLLAESVGLRSFHMVYGEDSFHFELPLAFQGSARDCYGFAIANSLPKLDKSYLRKTSAELARIGNEIAAEARGRKHGGSLAKAVAAAKKLGYISRFEKVDRDDYAKRAFWLFLKDDDAVVVSQKLNYSDKSGVDKHAYAFHSFSCRANKIMFRNSHKRNPIFEMKDGKEFSEVYKIYI